MDRLGRFLAGGTLIMALGMLLTAAGCRSMRNEVPPGKPYSTTGGPPSSGLGFNSDPHPAPVTPNFYGNNNAPGLTGQGTTQGFPGAGTTPGFPGQDSTTSSMGSNSPQYGIPAPSSNSLGAPTYNRYGPPSGTASVPGYDSGK
jgi:hypothetical protein